MSNIAKLKKKAAEFETRKNFDKALEIYEQVLTTKHAGDEERDVALYNRVGDLHYRIGNTEQALSYYEQAADLYAEGGFFNNAIALCNKILRYAPTRNVAYYKLGIISAKKGFNSDAKQNFLEYADRMQKTGKMDEAFRALKEFADLCPGQDDVRLMLAEQLARANRQSEALEQLELLYDMLEEEGRTSEAAAALERIKTLDPAFKPRRAVTPRQRKKEGLVFLDLDFDDAPLPPKATPAASSPSTPASETPAGFVEAPRADAPEGLELTSISDRASDETPAPEQGSASEIEPDATEGGSRSELKFLTPTDGEVDPIQEITPLDLDPLIGEPESSAAPELLDLEDVGPGTADAPEPNGQPARTPDSEAAPLADEPWLRSPESDDDFIDLGEWLERNRTPASTRMVAHDEEPEENEQKDFAEMLDKFKEGISRNVDEEDFESHYDLGIAFREMGLLDEAIGSFQKAARGPSQRVRASEAIGECFMDKGEAGVTMTVLERLVRETDMSDAQLVGVLYLLGRAAEALGRNSEAAAYFQRVVAVQIGFRDTARRLSSMAQASR